MLENEYVQTIKLVEINVDDRIYFLEITDVREIYIPELIIPIPLAEKSIVGITDIRGRIYTIIAMGQRLHSNGEHIKLTKTTRLVLLELPDIDIALYVDSVISMREVPISVFQNKSAVIKTDIDMKYIRSVGVVNGEIYVVLDLESLIVPLGPDQQLIRGSQDIDQLPERYIQERLPGIMKNEDIIIPAIDKPYQSIIQDTVKLTKMQKDTLQEVGNIGSGNAVTALSRLINKRIDVDLTDVGIISLEQLPHQFGNESEEIVCGIFSHIRKPSLSTILQVFELTPLMKLIAELAGKKSKINPDKVKTKKDLDDFAISTVTEFGNILAGHYASALADLLNTKMIFDVPEFAMSNAGNLGDFLAKELQEKSEYVVIIKTAIKVTDLQMNGIFFYIPDLKAIKNLFNKLDIYDRIEHVEAGGVLDKVFDLELTDIQKDALREVGNIGAGNAANALAKMINKRVDINIPSVEVVSIDQFANKMSKKNMKLFVSWSGVQGKTRATVLTLFKVPDITNLTSILIGDNGKSKIDLRKVKSISDFPEIYIDAMKELGHILASHYTTALGNLLSIRLMTEPPDISLDTGMKLFKILNEEIGLMKELSLVITTNVIIKEFKIQGTFLFIPELETLQELLDTLSTFYEV